VPWWDDQQGDVTWDIAHTRIPHFICPSAWDQYTNSVGTIVICEPRDSTGSPGGNSGTITIWYFPIGGGGDDLGRTCYLSIGGGLGHLPTNAWDRYKGVFTLRSENQFRDIIDGTSNTFLFIETTGGFNGNGSTLDFAHAWIGSGGFPTAWGIDPDQDKGRPAWWQLGSMHSGVVQTCLVDGSVRGISRNADHWSYVYTSGMGDGRIVDSEKVSP
jgi:hypothetical protein